MADSNAFNSILAPMQGDLFLVLEKWKVHFGAQLEDTWHSSHFKGGRASSVSNTIADLVETAKRRLNERGRVGEASVFLRDPREDRLVLLYSTSDSLRRGVAGTRQVRDVSYFDKDRRCYIYPLHDRLAKARERESDKARRARGLTGWVAVAGHHLLVNGEYGQQGLVSLAEDRPETTAACQIYGLPIWGRHISEAPQDPGKRKRYVAVPVRSTVDRSRTIGVLRYACPCSGKELTDPDLALMTELADLISASLAIDAAATRAARNYLLPLEIDHLRRTYDFGAFLEFIAKSLRSNIASLYLEVGSVLGHSSRLRLLHAYGLASPVALLRGQLQDYPSGDGFTRWLFDQGPPEPTVESSVHLHESWRGKNILAFYGANLKRLVNVGTSLEGQPTEVARQYEIKIMGVPLMMDQERVGVVKVELPDSFDDGRHYDKADQDFIAECAAALGDVVGEFQRFLRGEWFTGNSVHVIINVTRMAAEVLRTRVLSPAEGQYFWSELSSFIQTNEVAVSEELREILSRKPADAEAILESRNWFEKLARDLTTEVIAKVIVESASR